MMAGVHILLATGCIMCMADPLSALTLSVSFPSVRLQELVRDHSDYFSSKEDFIKHALFLKDIILITEFL